MSLPVLPTWGTEYVFISAPVIDLYKSVEMQVKGISKVDKERIFIHCLSKAMIIGYMEFTFLLIRESDKIQKGKPLKGSKKQKAEEN